MILYKHFMRPETIYERTEIKKAVKSSPEKFMPWNFEMNLI